jgi:hypothetical protein
VNKSEIQNPKSEAGLPVVCLIPDSSPARGRRSRIFEFQISNFGFFRRLRLSKAPNIEQAAALNRAERLFEVNFRSKWTR